MLTFLILMAGLMGVLIFVFYNERDYTEMRISIVALVVIIIKTMSYVVSFKPEAYDPNNIPETLSP